MLYNYPSLEFQTLYLGSSSSVMHACRHHPTISGYIPKHHPHHFPQTMSSYSLPRPNWHESPPYNVFKYLSPLCGDHSTSFLQVVVLSLASKSPSPHYSLTPQPSLCLVLLVEDHPQLTLGQEMVKSSLTVPHTASPYKWNAHLLGFRTVAIVAH